MQSGSEISVYKLHNTDSSKMHSKKVCCFPKLFAKYQMSNFWNNCNRQNSWAYLKWTARSITMHFFIKTVVWPQVEGALGRYLGLFLDFGMIFWTISGTVFCGYHLFWDYATLGDDATFGTNFWNIFLDLTLNELWTRVSSRSITMHFLSWKLSSGLKSGSNAFWGALEGLAPPLSMTSPVLFALALTSLSWKMA